MNGGRLNILAYGPKEDMLALERNLHENLPVGPRKDRRSTLGYRWRKAFGHLRIDW
jgi:hypothetical protein